MTSEPPPDEPSASIDPSLSLSLRLLDKEHAILATRRTSWLATYWKIMTLGLYVPWWRVAWFVVTNQRVIAKQGILNKTEIALPLHFVQDASVHRSWMGVGRVDISTAGGSEGNLRLEPLTAEDARRVADTIIHHAKPAGRGANAARLSHDPLTDSLERLAALRASGALTGEEFEQQKARLLDTPT